MHNIVRDVIKTGRFELSDMLRKIDTLWAQGQLTDDQRTGLLVMAREQADPKMTVDLYQMVIKLERRVADLEAGKAPDKPAEEFPEYVPGKVYNRGNGVTFGGGRYRCVAPEGAVCVWSPADYPAYWESV